MNLQQLILIVKSMHARNAIVFADGQIQIVWGATTRHFASEAELLAALEQAGADPSTGAPIGNPKSKI